MLIYGEIIFISMARIQSLTFIYNIFNFLVSIPQISNKDIPCLPNIWGKNGPSKIPEKQSLKNLKRYI